MPRTRSSVKRERLIPLVGPNQRGRISFQGQLATSEKEGERDSFSLQSASKKSYTQQVKMRSYTEERGSLYLLSVSGGGLINSCTKRRHLPMNGEEEGREKRIPIQVRKQVEKKNGGEEFLYYSFLEPS